MMGPSVHPQGSLLDTASKTCHHTRISQRMTETAHHEDDTRNPMNEDEKIEPKETCVLKNIEES